MPAEAVSAMATGGVSRDREAEDVVSLNIILFSQKNPWREKDKMVPTRDTEGVRWNEGRWRLLPTLGLLSLEGANPTGSTCSVIQGFTLQRGFPSLRGFDLIHRYLKRGAHLFA